MPRTHRCSRLDLSHRAGNKGGTAISLMFNETSFCFINSHLAAGVSHWDRRNQNASDITAGIRIGRRPFEATEQFDHTFWCGRTAGLVAKYRRSTKCIHCTGGL